MEPVMNKKIQIYDYIFRLEKSKSSNTVSSCDFSVVDKEDNEITEDEFRQASAYAHQIFDGDWDWLIFNRGLIKISEFKIEINLLDPIYTGPLSWQGGSITSEMKEVCPHCEFRNCNFDCPEAMEWASSQDFEDQIDNNEELAGNRSFNHGVDAIEVMILTHAMKGLNVESDMYQDGIRAALEGLANNT